jgi:hypothetical protein
VFIPEKDRWIYGVIAIGDVANIRDGNGNVDYQSTRRALELGYIDGEKFGRQWRSTARRILSPKPVTNRTPDTMQEAAQSP